MMYAYTFMLVSLCIAQPTCWARSRNGMLRDEIEKAGKENLINRAAWSKAFDSNQAERKFISTKRGAINFGIMTVCATGRFPLDYNGYGCWCGIGGKGTPVDDLDRCCHDHDWCYYDVRTSKICPLSEIANYLSLYSVKFGTCTECVPASSYLFDGECLNALCECDATAAKCFAKHPYNEKYRAYPQSKCKKTISPSD